MKIGRAILTGLALAGISGTLVRGGIPISTTETPWDGPLLENNRRARVETVEFYASPSVEIKYLDNHGRAFDMQRDVRKVLDVYLQKVPQIAPFLPESYKDGISSSSGSKGFPFQMYLLTISPLVVLVVPRARGEYSECSGGHFSTGIIASGAFVLDCYAYIASPKIRPGSFWFSPDLGITGQSLPEGKKTYSIDLNGSRLDLIANGDVWDVQRHILRPCSTSPTGCIEEEVATPRYVISTDGTEVIDARAKLVWQRCLVGMSWNGRSCTGTARTYSWDEASIQAPMEANANGKKWRVPVFEELSKIGSHTSKMEAFPENTQSWCWSSSPSGGPGVAKMYSCSHAFDVTMDAARNMKLAVRLVRSSQ